MNHQVREVTYVAVWTALIIVISQIAIPMPFGVPLTLQTLIIPLAGMVLGKRLGTLSTLIYVLLGIIGLPVFAGATAGPGIAFGPTGGFILSFPIMAFLCGYYVEKNGKLSRYIGLTLSSVINLLCGSLYFSWFNGLDFMYTISLIIIPLIPFAILKIVMAEYLSQKLVKHIQFRN